MAGIQVTSEIDANKKLERLRRGTNVTFTRFSRSVGRSVANKRIPALRKDLEIYVPERPGQTYQRTFNMRRGWKIKVTTPRPGFIVTTTNKMPYTHHVVGQPDMRFRAGGKGQAWMHKGRWWLAGGKIRKHYILMAQDYEKELLDVLEDQADITVKRRSKLLM